MQNILDQLKQRKKLKPHELMDVRVDDQGKRYLEIMLTKNKVAFADYEDYEILKNLKWRVCQYKHIEYAFSITKIKNGYRKNIIMSRLIMSAPSNMQVDHIDHNGLNNRRSNLRLCTASENAANRKKYYGSSIYKGVIWHKFSEKWRADITKNGKHFNVGYFLTEKEAAIAYNKKAKELYGDNAFLNFI